MSFWGVHTAIRAPKSRVYAVVGNAEELVNAVPFCMNIAVHNVEPGSRFILSNLATGIGVFESTTGQHFFTVALPAWFGSYKHGHRWVRDRLLVVGETAQYAL
jgi:hypothetical protein